MADKMTEQDFLTALTEEGWPRATAKRLWDEPARARALAQTKPDGTPYTRTENIAEVRRVARLQAVRAHYNVD